VAVKIFGDGRIEGIPVEKKRVAAFTGSGNWTVPAGVTYAIAHMRGGGGGSGQFATAGNGGASSVDFASGLVSAAGGTRGGGFDAPPDVQVAGMANSGRGARVGRPSSASAWYGIAIDGSEIVAAAAVTPAATIAVVVGAGGTAGTSGAAGGSGYVYIEYYEEV